MSKSKEMVVEVQDTDEAEYAAEVTESVVPPETAPVSEVPELAESAEEPVVVDEAAAPEAVVEAPAIETAPEAVVEEPTPVVIIPPPPPPFPATLNGLIALAAAHGVHSPEVTQREDGAWRIFGPIDHVFHLVPGPYAGGASVISISIKTLDNYKRHTLEIIASA